MRPQLCTEVRSACIQVQRQIRATRLTSAVPRDTLQRHISVHAKSRTNYPRGGARRKVRRACRSCSQSKQKCDGMKPCHRCVSKQLECLYENSTNSPEVISILKLKAYYCTDRTNILQPLVNNFQSLGPENDNTSENTHSDNSAWQQESNAGNNDSIIVGGDELGQVQSYSVQLDSTTTISTFASMPMTIDDPGNMHLPLFSNPSQQALVQAHALTGFQDSNMNHFGTNANISDFDSFGTDASGIAFWNDPQCPPVIYEDPYANFDLVFSMADAQNHQMETTPVDPESGQDLGSPPAPSFLDARSSPEPLEGQGMRFDDYIRRTFGNRRNLQGRGLRTPANGQGKTHVLPLIGDFSPILSSEDAAFWEPENLAHVRSLPQNVYDEIVAKYEKLNVTDGQYTEFASGAFPSLAACNAFMQLFFEEFSPLFPLLHHPTFDPASEPWLLVLAVIATGCRFSRITAAVSSGDLMQEFLRRAFFATVCVTQLTH